MINPCLNLSEIDLTSLRKVIDWVPCNWAISSHNFNKTSPQIAEMLRSKTLKPYFFSQLRKDLNSIGRSVFNAEQVNFIAKGGKK